MKKSMSDLLVFFFVTGKIVSCSPVLAAQLSASAASAAHELIMPSPHGTAEKRSVLGSFSRYLHTNSQSVRWAKLGVNLELESKQSLDIYIKEHTQCLARIKHNYENGNPLEKSHAVDGDQQAKLTHRLGFMVSCREEAEEVFKTFVDSADKDTAKRAALFLRASQLLSLKNEGYVPPYLQKTLKAERKKIRSALRNYLVNFGKPILRDLGLRQYLYTHLCDSDNEEEGQEAMNVAALKEIMKLDVKFGDDSKEGEDSNGDGSEEDGRAR